MSRKARKLKGFFRPKLGDLQKKKKRSSPKFRVIFRPKSEIQSFFPPKIRSSSKRKKKKKVFTQGPSRFSPELTQISSQKPESLMANLPRGGGHASILLTLLCNFAILATQRGGAMAQWPPP